LPVPPAPTVTVIAEPELTENPAAVLRPPAPPPPDVSLMPTGAVPPPPATTRYSTAEATGKLPPPDIVIPPPDIVNPLNIAIIYFKMLLNHLTYIYILYIHRLQLLLDYLLLQMRLHMYLSNE
jgi:hypothetical protein